MKYNNEFKLIDTADKAYVLGLIYSDGTITWNEGQSYQCKIKMNDVDVLKKIHKAFPFFCAPKPSNYNATYYIYCYSKEFVSDLMKHGLVPSKSIKNVDKLGNPGILCYPGDFIRGLFDGDGNIYIDKNNNKRITIYCNCKQFIDYVIDLYKQYNVQYVLHHRRVTKKSPYGIYELRVGAQKSVRTVVMLMHNPNSIYMDRKWNVLNNLTWKDLKAIKSAATKARYNKSRSTQDKK